MAHQIFRTGSKEMGLTMAFQHQCQRKNPRGPQGINITIAHSVIIVTPPKLVVMIRTISGDDKKENADHSIDNVQRPKKMPKS